MSEKKLVRSAKSSLKFANKAKLQTMQEIRTEYIRVMQIIITDLFNRNDHKFPKFIPKDVEQNMAKNTWLTTRMVQCAGKQALAVLKGTTEKQNRRKHQLSTMSPSDPNYTKLLNKINTTTYSCPQISDDTPMVLDSRMVELVEKDGHYGYWIKIQSIGNKIKLHIPVKKTNHMIQLENKGGQLNQTISISGNDAYFQYNITPEDTSTTPRTKILGIDIGINQTITAQDGQVESSLDGHTLKSIMTDMCRKKKGSKAFKRKQTHRKNHINHVINQLDLDGVKEVKCELIKDMRRGKNHGRFMSQWTYTAIFDKLKRKCEEQNVSISFISPTYTSQRCSSCGWTKDGNRNGLEFECDQCGNSMNADLNAAINLASGIVPIRYGSRKRYDIEVGFYWDVVCQASIVPDSKK